MSVYSWRPIRETLNQNQLTSCRSYICIHIHIYIYPRPNLSAALILKDRQMIFGLLWLQGKLCLVDERGPFFLKISFRNSDVLCTKMFFFFSFSEVLCKLRSIGRPDNELFL